MYRKWQFVQTVLGVIFRHPVPGTSIIPILPDGQIVLVRRRDNGKWSLPGGMVDWREDIATSVQRELAEETGLEVLEIARLVGVYSAPDRDPRLHSICVLVEAKVQGTIQIQDTSEILEAQPFQPSDIPLGTLSHDNDQQLQDYFDGKTTLA